MNVAGRGNCCIWMLKKIASISPGGGWRVHGRGNASAGEAGWTFVHSIVDDYTRLAYSEPLPDEKGTTVAAFTARALNNFHQKGITHIMGWPPTWRPPRRWRRK